MAPVDSAFANGFATPLELSRQLRVDLEAVRSSKELLVELEQTLSREPR